MPYVKADLLQRIEEAVDRTMRMALSLPRNLVAQVIGRQIVRSAGSVGANLEEAQAVITRKEYVGKISISLREARETLYWMRRIEKNGLLPTGRLEKLKAEWDELVAIMTAMQKKLRGQK